MRRRSLLSSLGALIGAGALSGCTGGGGVDTPSPSPSPTRTPSPGPPPAPRTSFEVVRRNCGTGDQRASVSFADGEVAIDGTIRGSDTCDTAALDAVELRDGELVVAVTTVREESTATMACAQCITDIAYAATVRIPDGSPDRVVVRHDGRIVTTADRP